MAICLFGVLCSVNQSLYQSNQSPHGIITSFYGETEIVNSQTSEVNEFAQHNPPSYNFQVPSESPCPYIFQYKHDAGSWKGEVKLNNLNIYKEIRLRVEITIQRQFNDHNSGTLQLTRSTKEALNDLLKQHSMVYHLIFPTQIPIPKIKGIYYNDDLICAGPGDVELPVTTVKLSIVQIYQFNEIDYLAAFNVHYHTFSHPVSQPQFFPDQTTIKLPVKPLKVETTHGVNIETSENIACGTPSLGLTQSLIIGGMASARGQWPWLVAFYKAGKGNLEFICGGNLISKIHVITAAHCIQDKQSNEKREAKTGVVYVGRHNLDNWNEEGFIKRGIKRFIVNEEWKPFDIKYDADIAIIVMDFPVEYSQYVRPICVWEFSDQLNDVVGKRGILTGWGLNENLVLNSEFPKMVQVPIVSEGTCLRSHPAILAVSSDRTFCAGGRNGEGPCRGDSGSGLILNIGDKWYLRGLVSTAPRDGSRPCDSTSFAVFTDVAKFVNWIASNSRD